ARPADPMASLEAAASVCFEHLRASELRPTLVRLAQGRTVEAERILLFHIGPYLATAALDVLASDEGRHCVVDWKVSRSPTADNTFQLDTYALAVSRAIPGAVVGTIDVVEVNLLTGTSRSRTPSVEDLESTENAIRSSATGLRSLEADGEDLLQ